MNHSKRRILEIFLVMAVILAMLVTALPTTAQAAPKTHLDPLTIPKYTNQLTQMPPVLVPTKAMDPQTHKMTDYYTMIATEFQQQILPAGFPKTTVWGYGGLAKDPISGQFLGFVRNTPGPSIVATRGTPINLAIVNGIYTKYLFAVDPTIDWTNPNNMPAPQPPVNAPPFPPGYAQAQYPVTIATHFHGGEIDTESDGGPFNWVSWNGLHGPDYHTWARTLPNAQVMHYPMEQAGGGLLWVHDHAMGLTRSNVYSGLAMGLLNIDPNDPVFPLLPFGRYWMPLVVQDRMFYTDGSLQFPSDPAPNPQDHPYWVPEFFGDTIMVNGKVWPNMNVDSGTYYFSFLEGSNARFYNMTFRVGAVDSTTILPMTVIAKDGNYIRSATNVDSLRMAPGERWSVLVNFTGLAPGSFVFITNDANAPFPDGTPADINTVGQIMRFTMTGNPGFVQHSLPAILNPTLAAPYPSLIAEPIAQYRNITLKEIQGAGGPLMVTVDGQTYLNPISENPRLGTTEIWRIIDNTGDAHPMHIHGVSFQIVQWQNFDQPTYDTDWLALNGPLPFDHPTLNVNLDNYLIPGTVTTPDALYSQWTDTTQVLPGTVTTIIVRFAPTYGGTFPYDPTDGTTYYVWHCHIVDHEDQDMIRPYHILPALI